MVCENLKVQEVLWGSCSLLLHPVFSGLTSILKEFRLHSYWYQQKFFPQLICLFFASCFFLWLLEFEFTCLEHGGWREMVVQGNTHNLFSAEGPLTFGMCLGLHRSFNLFHRSVACRCARAS